MISLYRVARSCGLAVALFAASAGELAPQAPPAAQQPRIPGGAAARDLFLTVNKSLIIDSPVDIERVSVTNGEIAEAVVVNPREVLINGKGVGETSLIIWQQGGNRMFFDVTVRPNTATTDAVQQEIRRDLPGQDIQFSFENNTVFLRGTAKDLVSAQRASSIASTLGKVVNLLNILVPPTETQILLKVRFANVDRAATQDLGINFMSTGAANTIGSVTTEQFTPPRVTVQPTQVTFTLTEALNIFLFRRDLDLGATIKALQTKRLLEILAEPNVLAINGKSASFLAGGEFPYPTLQGGGAGLGAVTIQFREFGVRINFLPVITPRGTIRLQVTPEVSSLDFANGLVFQGFNIPALSTRRVHTEIELDDRQSFAIGGLLDNRLAETFSKIPGLGDIPYLGKIFQSRTLSRNNTELVVLVTPEVVRPIPAGQPLPEIRMPKEFMKDAAVTAPRTPGVEITGPAEAKAPQSIPIEQLIESQKPLPPATQAPQLPTQFVPLPIMPAPAAPATAPPAAEAPKPKAP